MVPTLEPKDHVAISNEIPTTLQGTPNGAEHIALYASVIQDKKQQRRYRDKAWRDSLTT